MARQMSREKEIGSIKTHHRNKLICIHCRRKVTAGPLKLVVVGSVRVYITYKKKKIIRK